MANSDDGPFVATSSGETIASADKSCLSSPTFEVDSGGRRFQLKSDRFFGGNFEIFESEEVVGFVQRRRSLIRRITVEVPSDLSAPARVFLPWLVLVLWDRAEYHGA